MIPRARTLSSLWFGNTGPRHFIQVRSFGQCFLRRDSNPYMALGRTHCQAPESGVPPLVAPHPFKGFNT